MKNLMLIFCCLLLLALTGCSSGNSEAPLVSGGSGSGAAVHVTGWVSLHSTQAKADLRGCQGCHGFDFKGSGLAVSCFKCHTSGPPFVGAHPASWNADPLNSHQQNFQGTLSDKTPWTSCANAACHGTDLQGTGSSGAPSCMNATASCHATSTNGGWPPAPHPSYVSPTVHGPAAKGKTDAALSMGNYCVLCHADATKSVSSMFDGGFVAQYYGGKGNCSAASCHPVATAHPTNWVSTRSGASVFHNDGNITSNSNIIADSCALCHRTTDQTQSPFSSAPTCFNATFDNGTGAISCHDGGPFNVGAPHAVPFVDASLHGPAAKADLTYCQPCHADTGTASTFGVAGSNPRFNLPKGSMTSGCEDCHATGAAHATGADRWTFNQDATYPTRRTHFAAGVDGTNPRDLSGCSLCHNVTDVDSNTQPAEPCTTCHQSLIASGPSKALKCTVCHETPPKTGTPNLTGATLVNHATGTDVTTIPNHEECSICHGASESTGTPGTLVAKSADYLLFSGTGQGGDHLDGKIEVNSAVGYQDATATNAAERFGCSAACHPNDTSHQLSASGLTTSFGNYTVGSISCTDCHGQPPGAGSSAPGVTTSVDHTAFTDSGAALLANHGQCQTCHGTRENSSTPGTHDPLSAYTPGTNHYNGKINMNSDTSYNPANFGCDNAVCHANDTTPIKHRLPNASGLTIEYGAYGAGSCSTCHDYPPKGDKIPLTAPANTTPVSHLGSDGTGAKLLANHNGCQVCHGTRESTTNPSTHDPLAPYVPGTHHRDGKVEMNSDAGYNTTNNGCDIACHPNSSGYQLSSAGPGLSVQPLALGISGACDSCHGGLPTDATTISSNAHTKHVESLTSVSITCDVCHGHMGSGTTHRNGTVDVLATFTSGLAAGGTFASTTKQCSNVYCHGKSNVVDWDAGIAIQCGDCHGAPGTGRPDGALKPSGGNHLSTTHAAQACNICHPHNGSDTTNHVDGSPAANSNGDAQISTTLDNSNSLITTHSYGVSGTGSPDADGFRYSATSCSSNSASCHTTASWGATGGCNFCHGYPPNSTNNKHASGVTAVNHDAAGILSNHDECSYCHGVKDSGGSQLAMATSVLGGSYTYVTATDHLDGKVTMNGDNNSITSDDAAYNSTNGGCDNSACHGNDTGHRVGTGNSAIIQNRDLGPGTCGACHDLGLNGAPIVTAISTHVITTVGGTYVDCTDCHSGHVGSGGGVDIALPPSNWTNAAGESHVTGNMQTALGIDYTSHGGIHLGGAGTDAAISGKTTEAEICWGCHGANSGISEWGYNADTNDIGGTYPSTTIASLNDGSQGSHNYGHVYTTSGHTTETSAWVDNNGVGYYRLDGYQNNVVLNRQIASVHSVNMAGSGLSSVGKNFNPGTGQVTRGVAGNLETPSQIRCSYCHDVHELHKAAGDIASGRPYLRGSWMGNPYPPDMPPMAGQVYPTTGGPDGKGQRYYSTHGGEVFPVGVPRLYADSTIQDKGGYFIDQNSQFPTSGRSLSDTAGICVLCHGTDVNAMDYYTADSLWRTDQINGHSNAALGGTGTNQRNLFDGRRGGGTGNTNPMWMGAQDGVGVLQWGDKYRNVQNKAPFRVAMNQSKKSSGSQSASNNAWYGGILDNVTRGAQYGAWYSGNTSVTDVASIGTNGTDATAHKFTCSKCHSPHATGLPALLITNCLDYKVSTWSATGSSVVGPTTTNTYAKRTMNNCHRNDGTTTGWNQLGTQQ